jgi:hypothetical protein
MFYEGIRLISPRGLAAFCGLRRGAAPDPCGVRHANKIAHLFCRKSADILASLRDQASAALIAGVNPQPVEDNA